MTNERLVYTVPQTGRLSDMARPMAYDAVKRGKMPTIRVGRRLLVPAAALRRMLDVDMQPKVDDEGA